MIKGVTLVHEVPSSEVFGRLSELFTALGFESGKGWREEQGRGAAFLAPLANLEMVLGRAPATPRILIEVTELEQIHAAVRDWMGEGAENSISAPEATHWNSRLFRAQLANGLEVGFWQSENPLHGRPIAIEGDLSAAGRRFAIVVARWNAVITDRLLQGSLDALMRSGCEREVIEIVRGPRCVGDPVRGSDAGGVGTVCGDHHPGSVVAWETAHYEAIYTRWRVELGSRSRRRACPMPSGC